MKTIGVFLDRDGVINEERDYVHTVDEFKFIEHAIEAMKIIKDKGYVLMIVTNQSGIARGLYTEDDFLKLTEWMDWSLQEDGVVIDGVYYCPHHPVYGVGKYKCDCECRKPKPGMILEAAEYKNIDLTRSYMVGDKEDDIRCGMNAGIKNNYLVRTGHKLEDEAIKLATGVYDSLYEFATKLPTLNELEKAVTEKIVSEDGYVEAEEAEEEKKHQKKIKAIENSDNNSEKKYSEHRNHKESGNLKHQDEYKDFNKKKHESKKYESFDEVHEKRRDNSEERLNRKVSASDIYGKVHSSHVKQNDHSHGNNDYVKHEHNDRYHDETEKPKRHKFFNSEKGNFAGAGDAGGIPIKRKKIIGNPEGDSAENIEETEE